MYDDGETVILKQRFPDGLKGTVGDKNGVISKFPSIVVGDDRNYTDFSSNPRGFLQFKGTMLGSGAEIGRWTSKGVANLIGSGLEDTGPLVIFDADEAIVISAASEFMSMNQAYDSATGELAFGVMGSVMDIPKGFETEFIVSYTRGTPRDAMEAWGAKLRARYGKNRDVALSDFTTNYLQYSTDNGAFYYYLTEQNKTYEQTIVDVKAYADKEGIPYRQWLMDSWWYFKGDGDGVKNWTAMPSIFPHGIDFVYDATEWPIVAHNRYWSANTDYAKQNGGDWDFVIEPKSAGGLAFPLQQEFWDWLLSDASKWGLRTYEQDWLYNEFSEMNYTLSSPTAARQWLIQMGTAAEKQGLTVQYCMSWSRHILQSVELQAVTQARASDDYHPGNEQWEPLGLTGMFAHAIGIKPTKDNFWSTQGESGRYKKDTEGWNRLQAVVSTLSTGPVAPSDMIGGSDAKLIMRSCNDDGLLLQPDYPATKVTSAIYQAAGIISNGPVGDVWATETTLSGVNFGYLLAVNTKPSTVPVGDIVRGFPDVVRVAWETNSTSKIVHLGKSLDISATDKSTFQLWTVAPVLPNGFIFMGEAETKWVSVSNDRFRNLEISSEGFTVEFTGKPGETVEMMYSKAGHAGGAEYAAVDATYKCTVCNHVYDADKDGGGVPFEQLPDTWKCPICGSPKSAYVKQADGTWVERDHHLEFKEPAAVSCTLSESGAMRVAIPSGICEAL